MCSIKIKSFFDHKRGVDYWDGADRLAMNLERGRFAVADGVSQSFLPNLWAEILCNSFVNSDADAEEDWIGHYSENQLAVDCQLWRERSEDTLRNANEEEAFLLQLSKDEYKFAGSTLVGIVIRDHSVFYNVLGDSCLFVFDKETRSLTSYSTINEQVGFTTAPDYLLSGGKVVGQWRHGSIPLKPGILFLLTDALSEWFTKEYAENPTLVEQLWALDSHKVFMELVEDARETDAMKDDDVALMMLKVEDEYDVLYCDTMESLIGQQTQTDDDNTNYRDASENSEKNIAPDGEKSKIEFDEETQDNKETVDNEEDSIMSINIVERSNIIIDEDSESVVAHEEIKSDEPDKCLLELSSDNADVSTQSKEETVQMSIETAQLEQKQKLTENEKTDVTTNIPVIKCVHRDGNFCSHCGWQYFSNDSMFCVNCGHPREFQI